MSSQAFTMVVPPIRSLFDGGSVAGLSDAQLLARFNARRDDVGEAAFSALVERHGPMVLGLCRRLVGDPHLAEDAFQAVFLILARKAPSLSRPDLLGNWLYGVTIRTARTARLRQAGMHRLEDGGPASGEDGRVVRDGLDPTVDAILARESNEVLHDEIERLPRSFRLPVVLCYFEGLSLDDAARRLNWPQGTLRSRLARARDKLRGRLERRGVCLSAAAMATILDGRPCAAAFPRALGSIGPRRAASAVAEGLARQTLAAGLLLRLAQKAAVGLLGLAALGGMLYAAGLAAGGNRPDAPEVVQIPSFNRPSAVANEEPPAARKAARRNDETMMTVVGKVVDPSGKPVAAASVDVVGRSRRPWVVRGEGDHYVVLGSGRTGPDGRFRFQASRSSSVGYFEVYAVANAPGFGLGWASMNPNASEPSADLALSTERVIRGIVTDPDGKPAAGVSIVVRSVGRPTNLGGYDGVNLGIVPENASPGAWPRRATTDAQGRFTIQGTGPTANVRVEGIDGRSPMAHGIVNAKEGAGEAEVSLRFHRTAVVDGRVLAADTGLGLPRATVEHSTMAVVSPAGPSHRGSIGNTRVETDAQGRFRATVAAGSQYRISVHPAEGQPYFVTETDDLDAVGPEKGLTKELRLTRGVLIRGKVVESGTGKPLENAAVQYLPAREPKGCLSGWQAVVASGKDGSYQIAVPRGKGRLFVHGPTSDYVVEEIGSNVVHKDQPGGTRLYAHKILAYDATEGDEPREIDAELRRGKVVRGRVAGPGGAAVDKALIVALLQFNYFHLEWRGDLTQFVRDGRFELHGLDPEKPTQVMFLDAEHQWGATVELSGRQGGEDVLIRLEPCGRAEARFLGPDGKPLHQYFPSFEILGAPGVDQWDDRPEAKTELSASGASMTGTDRKNYWAKRSTGPDGRFAFPALIPGATYRIIDTSTMNDRGHGSTVRRDFTVKPGEALDLGDILVAKPPSS